MSPTGLLEGAATTRARKAGWLLLLALALLSTAAGVRNAAHTSQDFQWSGERLLLAHADPWAAYLAGDPEHSFVLSQVPNYLPILYVLLAPLGLLPLSTAQWVWALLNVCFAIISVAAAGRAYRLSWRSQVLVGCLFLMATPTRNSIGNGQQGLPVLMLWCLTLLSPGWGAAKASWSGLAYFKFSFAPPMLCFLFFRRGVKAVLWSLLPAALSLILVWLWITGGHDPVAIFRMAAEPLAVARRGFSAAPDNPNLMNLLEPLLMRFGAAVSAGVELAVATAICAAVSRTAFRDRGADSIPWQMALMATMSYGLFKHHPYDAVVLLLPLCHAVACREQGRAKAVLGLIAYMFYGRKLLEAAHLHPAWVRLPEFLGVMAILYLTYRIGPPRERLQPRKGIHAVTRTANRAAA